MKGIQYIVDDKGEKTAVVIDLKQWGNIWEKFYSFFANNLFSDVEEKLETFLPLNSNNSPQDYEKIAQVRGILKHKHHDFIVYSQKTRQEWE